MTRVLKSQSLGRRRVTLGVIRLKPNQKRHMNKDQLTELFRNLGASEPDDWASSEIDEGIPQLARYLFLKGAWDRIATDDDTSWIDNVISNVPPNSADPYSGAAHSMRRMIAAGVSKSDIAQLIRSTQAEFLFDLCYMMDDPGAVAGNDSLVNWAFVEVDDNDNAGRQINGLHESVLKTDPTGREACPRPDGG